MTNKLENLKQQLERLGRVAVALSGGNDSNLLLHIAAEVLQGGNVIGICARTEFNTAEETIRIELLQKKFDIEIVDVDVMRDEIVANGVNRCYICKKLIMSAILARAAERGFAHVIDGNNASDNPAERVGMRACRELGVISPYVDCEVEKSEIIDWCEQYCIKVEPSNSCLATRIGSGKLIEKPLLDMVSIAENKLTQLGFPYSRVRIGENIVTVELESFDNRNESTEREILRELESIGREIRFSDRERRSLRT